MSEWDCICAREAKAKRWLDRMMYLSFGVFGAGLIWFVLETWSAYQ